MRIYGRYNSSMVSDDDIVKRLSSDPPQIKSGMTYCSTPAPTKLWNVQIGTSSTPSSLGLLDKCPTEIITAILSQLDFGSLCRLARCSRHGKALVETLPAYRDIVELTPGILSTLKEVGLLALHSSGTLFDVLHSPGCAVCGDDFGAWLFLPTCERCCWECLYARAALRVLPVAEAGRCFQLDEARIRAEMPVLHSIPANYWVGVYRHVERSEELVCLRHVRELALRVHGDLATLPRLELSHSSDSVPTNLQALFEHREILQYFRKADLGTGPSRSCDLRRPPIVDYYNGMASSPFPSVTDRTATNTEEYGSGSSKTSVRGQRQEKQLEHGLYCKGCTIVWVNYDAGKLDEEVLHRLVPPDVEPWRVIRAAMLRAWSRRGLLDHAQKCYGNPDLGMKISSFVDGIDGRGRTLEANDARHENQ